MERSRNVEDLHHLRLMALLHELVRERELKGAAEALGLDPRTLSASMDRGALSGLSQVALERWLLAEGDREAARRREEVQALAGRYDGLASDGSGTEMVGASCGGRSWPLLAVGWPGAGCCAGLGRGITPGLRQRRAVLLWGSVAFCGVAMLWQGFCVAGNAFGPLPLPPRSLRTLNRLRSALYT